jgi:hypothetical protein
VEEHSPSADPAPPVPEQNGQFTLLHLANLLIHNGAIVVCAIIGWYTGRAIAGYWNAPPRGVFFTQALLVALSVPFGWVVHQLSLLAAFYLLVIVVAFGDDPGEKWSPRGRIKEPRPNPWSQLTPFRRRRKVPPIRTPDLVDYTSKQPDGWVTLYIWVAEPLDDSAPVLESLRTKCQTYLAVITLDAFQAEMGHPSPDKTTIRIVCFHPIPPMARAVLEEYRALAAGSGVRFELSEPTPEEATEDGSREPFTALHFFGPFIRDLAIGWCAALGWGFGRIIPAPEDELVTQAFSRHILPVLLGVLVGWIVAWAFGCARYPGRRFWVLEYLERRRSE